MNPAVSVAMFSLGRCDYTEMYVRICASMAGGLVAFPLFLFFSESAGLVSLGGPEYSASDEKDDFSAAFLNEFFAFFLFDRDDLRSQFRIEFWEVSLLD